MLEQSRIERNQARLAQCYPAFRAKVEAVLHDLEAHGYRPRIQESYRSPEEQLRAYTTGKSKLKYGFHNVTGPKGAPEALAADVYDDDEPLNPSMPYKLRLAHAAEHQGLITGIRWGLSMRQIDALNAIIKHHRWHEVPKIGWDPLHVEVRDISVAQARAGKRPV